MIYLFDDRVVKNDIKWIVPILVLPHIMMKVVDIPFGPSVASTCYLCIYLFLCRYASFRGFVKCGPLLLWGGLILYHCINSYLKQVPAMRPIDYYHSVKMYCAVCIYSYLFCVDLKNTSKYLAISIFIWLIMACFVSGFGYSGKGRLSGKTVVAVTFGKYSAMLIVCLTYYVAIMNRKWSELLLFSIPSFIIIFLSQTRNAFGMSCIQLVGFYIGVKVKGRLDIRTIGRVLFLSFVIFFGISFMLDNSQIGTRFQEKKSLDYYEWKGLTTGTAFDKIAGERLIYYVKGFELFLENPITGIGFKNYSNRAGGIYPMHVEYMVHLCEGGIIAAILFVSFLYCIAINILKRGYNRPVLILLSSTFMMQIFTCVYSSSFSQEIPVLIYGLLIAAGSPFVSLTGYHFDQICCEGVPRHIVIGK